MSAFDWRAAAAYVATRLSEPSTRLAVGAILSRILGHYTPEDVSLWLEVTGYVLTGIIAAIPDRRQAA
ncbi:hypothetical protein [Azospirillum picis]|uniref:Uncharacterized protein n=1 Tax=Azospirillum picis TaxID=488438 RepID=A0ABU0MEB4_9PROT|nr:hypothetical protein [Azospirillum picis]MBP2297938.1 hypothetical protein [Azospirillum picis]MDQ0531776.1 hypothetical protein [Azospirillum picis]